MFLQPLHTHNHIYMQLQDKIKKKIMFLQPLHTHNHIYMQLQDKEDNH